jgi:hypothetical protein
VGEPCRFKVDHQNGERAEITVVPLTDDSNYAGSELYYDPKTSQKQYSPEFSRENQLRKTRSSRRPQ